MTGRAIRHPQQRGSTRRSPSCPGHARMAVIDLIELTPFGSGKSAILRDFGVLRRKFPEPMAVSSEVRDGRAWFGGRIPLPPNPNLDDAARRLQALLFFRPGEPRPGPGRIWPWRPPAPVYDPRPADRWMHPLPSIGSFGEVRERFEAPVLKIQCRPCQHSLTENKTRPTTGSRGR